MAKDDKQTLAEAGVKPPPPSTSANAPRVDVKAKAATVAELQEAIDQHKPVTGEFILTERHYRLGRLYEPGERVRVVNEVPGKSWRPFDPDALRPAAAPVLPSPGSVVEQDL